MKREGHCVLNTGYSYENKTFPVKQNSHDTESENPWSSYVV